MGENIKVAKNKKEQRLGEIKTIYIVPSLSEEAHKTIDAIRSVSKDRAIHTICSRRCLDKEQEKLIKRGKLYLREITSGGKIKKIEL